MECAFDSPVPSNGYRWWYIDVVSDDGQHGLTIIAMIGSVFSPYYARARRRGTANPFDFCAVNVALYQRGQGRWALTERGVHDLQRSPATLGIGRSSLHWQDGQLVVTIDERCSPWPHRLQGTLRVDGPFREDLRFALDPAGRHHWGPIAPATRAHLTLQSPAVAWSGDAYLDSNTGSAPLEQDFQRWHWSRQTQPDGSTLVHYDVDRRDGGTTLLSVQVDRSGPARLQPSGPRAALPGTGWRVARSTRLQAAHTLVERTLEDTPFYARSLLRTNATGSAGGEAAQHAGLVMHESLDLDRFRQIWVQCLLPFRMPRWTRRPA